jgi:hypothetical protein
MQQMRLKKGTWQFDSNSPIGKPGGFGAVFAGQGEQHDAVAIKRLHITASEAAHRELRIVDELLQRPLAHVIPMLDDGQDAESDLYYVIMARAECSLQEEVNRIGVFSEKDAVSVLGDIATGLAEVRDIVHRDLKPANVLLHDGKWKLADFGIARFVEESTSLQTLKDFLSAQYAAPEQWLGQRATPATDFYALGCIAHALLTGSPPFQGPKREDYQEQHLHTEPPPLKTQDPRLRTLVATMLRKRPETRPSIDRVIRLLDEIAIEEARGVQSEGFRELAHAGAAAAEASLQADAERMASEALKRRRQEPAERAFKTLREISETFLQRIQAVVFDIERIDNRSPLEPLYVRFGDALLRIAALVHGKPIPEGAFPRSGWDVIAGATIHVAQTGARRYRGGERARVLISASHGPAKESMTLRQVDHEQVVRSDDPDLVIHIATSDMDQFVLDRIGVFEHSLDDLGIAVSTGRVVDFRAAEFLRADPGGDTVPLIYPPLSTRGLSTGPGPVAKSPMPSF